MSSGDLIVSNEFFVTGQPYINFKRFISKLYLNEILFKFFGFGKKKFVASVAKECLNANFRPNQVIELMLKLYQRIFSIKMIKHKTYQSIVQKFITSIPFSLDYVHKTFNIHFLNRYESMKSFVVSSMNEVNSQNDLYYKENLRLLDDLQQLKQQNSLYQKELEIKNQELQMFQEDVDRKEKHISQLSDQLSTCSTMIDFRNETVVQLKKREESLKQEISSTKKNLMTNIKDLQQEKDSLQTIVQDQKIKLEFLEVEKSKQEKVLSDGTARLDKIKKELDDLKRKNKSNVDKINVDSAFSRIKVKETLQEIDDKTFIHYLKETRLGSNLLDEMRGSYKFSAKDWKMIKEYLNGSIVHDAFFRIFKILAARKILKSILEGFIYGEWNV